MKKLRFCKAICFSVLMSELYSMPASSNPSTADAYMSKGREAFSAEKPKIAIKWFIKAGEDGETEGYFMAGNLVLFTGGKTERAVELFIEAAKLGHLSSQFQLATLFYAEKTYGRAAPWAIKAAAGGHGPAKAIAGLCYIYGKGVPKNPVIAQTYFSELINSKDVSGIKEIQTHLRLTGFYKGPLNGVFGKESRAAFERMVVHADKHSGLFPYSIEK